MMVHLDPFGGILQRNDQKIQLPLTTMILNNWLNSGSNIHYLPPIPSIIATNGTKQHNSSDHWNLDFLPVQLCRVRRLFHVVPPFLLLGAVAGLRHWRRGDGRNFIANFTGVGAF